MNRFGLGIAVGLALGSASVALAYPLARDGDHYESGWTALLPDLKPPSTPRAPEVRAALREVIDGASDSPFNPAVFSFVGAIVRDMKERGEL